MCFFYEESLLFLTLFYCYPSITLFMEELPTLRVMAWSALEFELGFLSIAESDIEIVPSEILSPDHYHQRIVNCTKLFT